MNCCVRSKTFGTSIDSSPVNSQGSIVYKMFPISFPFTRIPSFKKGASKMMSSETRWRLKSSTEKPLRSEEHTSELQSRLELVCRLLLEKKNNRHDTSKL